MSDILVQNRVVRKKGPVVSFSGMDGSGKTALALVAAEELRRQGFRVRILRIYPFSVKSLFVWIARNLLAGIFPPEDIRKKTATGETNAFHAVWKRHCFRIERAALKLYTLFLSDRGFAVICDRHVYDSLARLLYEGACDETGLKTLAKTIPVPDVAFLLRATPETIRAMKKEDLNVDFDAAMKAYMKLTDVGEFWIVDTNDLRRAAQEIRGILSYEGRRW